jgi:hypothetical protein
MKWTFDVLNQQTKKNLSQLGEFYLKYNYKKVRCNHREAATKYLYKSAGRQNEPTLVNGIWLDYNELKLQY